MEAHEVNVWSSLAGLVRASIGYAESINKDKIDVTAVVLIGCPSQLPINRGKREDPAAHLRTQPLRYR